MAKKIKKTGVIAAGIKPLDSGIYQQVPEGFVQVVSPIYTPPTSISDGPITNRLEPSIVEPLLGVQDVTAAPAEDDATAEAPTTEEIQSVEIDEASRRLAAKNAAIAFKQARLDKQLQLSLKATIDATVANFKKFGFEVEVESDCADGIRHLIIIKE